MQNNDLPQILRVLLCDPECVCCPLADLCTVPPGFRVNLTKEVRIRSGCDGAVFETWDRVDETYFDGSEITIGIVS